MKNEMIRFIVIAIAAVCAACTSSPYMPEMNTSEELVVDRFKDGNGILKDIKTLSRHKNELISEINLLNNRSRPIPILLKPRRNSLEEKTVNIKMASATPAQLLTAVADQMESNLLIDPAITDSDYLITMNLSGVTLLEAIEKIAQNLDIAYKYTGQSIQFFPVQDRFYDLDILSSKVNVAVNAGGDVLGGDSKSGASVTAKTMATMTGEVGLKEDVLDQITKMVEVLVSGSPPPSQSRAMASKTEKDTAAGSADSTASGAGATNSNTKVRLDRAQGKLYVRARPSKIKLVDEYIWQLKESYQRQIQVDLHLVDLRLSQVYRMGVDWNLLGNSLAGRLGFGAATARRSANSVGISLRNPEIEFPTQEIGYGSVSQSSFGLGWFTQHVAAVLNALEGFGSTKLLSSPSLRLKNNAPAQISVGTSYRYVSKVSSTSTPGIGAGGSTVISKEIVTDNVFSGIMLAVSANITKNSGIELFIQPMQTIVDQGSLQLQTVSSESLSLPIIDIKSMTTTLTVSNGEVIVLGGLINQQNAYDKSGLPGTQKTPVIKNILGVESDTMSGSELIIILTARII